MYFEYESKITQKLLVAKKTFGFVPLAQVDKLQVKKHPSPVLDMKGVY